MIIGETIYNWLIRKCEEQDYDSANDLSGGVKQPAQKRG